MSIPIYSMKSICFKVTIKGAFQHLFLMSLPYTRARPKRFLQNFWQTSTSQNCQNLANNLLACCFYVLRKETEICIEKANVTSREVWMTRGTKGTPNSWKMALGPFETKSQKLFKLEIQQQSATGNLISTNSNKGEKMLL